MLIYQVVGLFFHGTKPVHELPGPVAVETGEVDAMACQIVRGRSHREAHEGTTVRPTQLQQGIIELHANLLRTLDPALWHTGASHPHPVDQRLLGRSEVCFCAVDGWRDQEAHPEPSRPIDIILPIVHTVCSCEDVPLRHENSGAAGGDPHSCGEGVIQQEVVTLYVKAAIRSIDLPSHTPGLHSPGRRVSSSELCVILHIYRGESARAVGVQGLECQFLRELLPLLFLLSSVEAACVAVSGEIQLSVSTEAGAGQRRRSVRDQRGDVGWRRVEEREGQGELKKQVSQEGAPGRRHRGDGKH